MAKDPVCGMEIDPKEAAGKSQCKGVTYYFCGPAAKGSLTSTRKSTRTRVRRSRED